MFALLLIAAAGACEFLAACTFFFSLRFDALNFHFGASCFQIKK